MLKIDMTLFFFYRGWSDLDKIPQTGAEWHVDCSDMVEIETRCIILIWGTFGRIELHVIPEPPTLSFDTFKKHLKSYFFQLSFSTL